MSGVGGVSNVAGRSVDRGRVVKVLEKVRTGKC